MLLGRRRFFSQVRSETSAARQWVSRRKRCVSRSGCQTPGRQSQRSNSASIRESTLSVLILASAMLRSYHGEESCLPDKRPRDREAQGRRWVMPQAFEIQRAHMRSYQFRTLPTSGMRKLNVPSNKIRKSSDLPNVI